MRGDGDRLPQRQRLDRREDGRRSPAHLRPGRDEPAQGDCARGALRAARRRLLHLRRELPGPLHRRSHQAPEAQEPPQGRLRLRQRHRRRVCAAGARRRRLRGLPARLRARPHLPQIQSQHRRHEDAARDARRGVARQGGRGARFRRRRRPLRRRRQRGRGNFRRQGGRDARARHLRATQGRDFRRRCEVDRPVHDRPGAARERRQGRLLEDRPLLHEAPRQRDRRDGGLREIRPLLLQPAARPRLRRRARVRARGLRHARPQSRKKHGRPGLRPPWRRTAPTRSNTAWSTTS